MARAGYSAWDDDEAFFDERPARRARRKPVRWIRLILMSSLMIAGLVYFARQKGDEAKVVARTGVPSSVLIAPAPVWNAVASGPALYAIDKTFGTASSEARQHTSGAREDTLSLGRFGEARHARLTLIQGSSEPSRSFFVDIVRRAADAGLAVSRNAQSRMIVTKFGPVEVAAMSLVGKSEQDCQTFRFKDHDSGFGFQGWLCDTQAEAIDDAQLACFIDGVMLNGAGSPSLKALFARSERNRTDACGAAARTASIGVRTPGRP
ncbi:hypothetical protein [Microvirga solisilvae]|uniref:hypothetical protein n=1 Tax=Microvirga solisilvae TaxID=2919498 RepID=UPI001FB02489|nr:hypothetical protein [Microvirga solisilvae]